MTMTVRTHHRDYTLTLLPSGASFPLTQTEADRLIASHSVEQASANRVDLKGVAGGYKLNRPDMLKAPDDRFCAITPAVDSEKPAFEID